MDKILSIR